MLREVLRSLDQPLAVFLRKCARVAIRSGSTIGAEPQAQLFFWYALTAGLDVPDSPAARADLAWSVTWTPGLLEFLVRGMQHGDPNERARAAGVLQDLVCRDPRSALMASKVVGLDKALRQLQGDCMEAGGFSLQVARIAQAVSGTSPGVAATMGALAPGDRVAEAVAWPAEEQGRRALPLSRGSHEGLLLIQLAGHVCCQCGKEAVGGGAFPHCARCKQPTYCSRECQSDAWKQHKLECFRPKLGGTS